jgi:hypothetical protein
MDVMEKGITSLGGWIDFSTFPWFHYLTILMERPSLEKLDYTMCWQRKRKLFLSIWLLECRLWTFDHTTTIQTQGGKPHLDWTYPIFGMEYPHTLGGFGLSIDIHNCQSNLH